MGKILFFFFMLGVFSTAQAQAPTATEKRWEELSKRIQYEKGEKKLNKSNKHYKSKRVEPDDLEESSYNKEVDPNASIHQKITEKEILNSRKNTPISKRTGDAPLRKKDVDNRRPFLKDSPKSSSSKTINEPDNLTNTTLWKTILIVFAIVLIGVLIYFLFFNTPKSTYVSNNGDVLQNNLNPSSIAEDEYTKQLKAALANNDFRLALRINYLMVLRALIDAKKIRWEKDKTNAAYLIELRTAKYHTNFLQLVSAFDRVWYGHYTISEVAYQKVEHTCKALINALENDEK